MWLCLGTITYLLLDLQSIYDRTKLCEDLLGLLVVFDLGSNEIREVAKGLRSIKNLSKRGR